MPVDAAVAERGRPPGGQARRCEAGRCVRTWRQLGLDVEAMGPMGARPASRRGEARLKIESSASAAALFLVARGANTAR